MNGRRVSMKQSVHLCTKAQKERGSDYGDGLEISKLAMECVAFVPSNSPKMKQVVKPLLNLFAVLRHADDLGIKQMLCGDD